MVLKKGQPAVTDRRGNTDLRSVSVAKMDVLDRVIKGIPAEVRMKGIKQS
jgi:hypothetical protein